MHCAALRRYTSDRTLNAVWGSHVIQRIVRESGGVFADLQPAVQALLQAAAKRIIRAPDAIPGLPAISTLLSVVPLLHAADYDHLLTQCLAGEVNPAMAWLPLLGGTYMLACHPSYIHVGWCIFVMQLRPMLSRC